MQQPIGKYGSQFSRHHFGNTLVGPSFAEAEPLSSWCPAAQHSAEPGSYGYTSGLPVQEDYAYQDFNACALPPYETNGVCKSCFMRLCIHDMKSANNTALHVQAQRVAISNAGHDAMGRMYTCSLEALYECLLVFSRNFALKSGESPCACHHQHVWCRCGSSVACEA